MLDAGQTIPRELFMRVISDCGFDEDHVFEELRRGDVSGLAVRFEYENEVYEFFATLGEEDGDVARRLARNCRDGGSLGTGWLVFWPGFSFER